MNKTTSIVFLFLTLVITGCDRCNECKNSVSPNAYLPKLDDKGKPIISASLADFNCGVMPKDIFRYEYVKFNEKYRYSFYDYVYQLDIKTEKDAVDAGLDVTIPTEFLVPIGLGGTFNYDRHRQWRTEYEHERKVIESRDIAYENIKRYADTSITNTWLRCKYLEARTKEKGLHCLFQDAGVSRIILSATYDPYGNNDPSTKIKKITIKGGKLEDSICSSLRPGEKIGTGGKSAYILRERNQLLSVIFETEQKTYDPLTYPAPPELAIMIFSPTSLEVQRDDSVQIQWDVLASKSIAINGESVTSQGSKKIKISTDTTFKMVAIGNYKDTIKQEFKIKATPRPITVLSAQISIGVPHWANGKDADTRMHFYLVNQNNVTIGEYKNERKGLANKFKAVAYSTNYNLSKHTIKSIERKSF